MMSATHPRLGPTRAYARHTLAVIPMHACNIIPLLYRGTCYCCSWLFLFFFFKPSSAIDYFSLLAPTLYIVSLSVLIMLVFCSNQRSNVRFSLSILFVIHSLVLSHSIFLLADSDVIGLLVTFHAFLHHNIYSFSRHI